MLFCFLAVSSFPLMPPVALRHSRTFLEALFFPSEGPVVLSGAVLFAKKRFFRCALKRSKKVEVGCVKFSLILVFLVIRVKHVFSWFFYVFSCRLRV